MVKVFVFGLYWFSIVTVLVSSSYQYSKFSRFVIDVNPTAYIMIFIKYIHHIEIYCFKLSPLAFQALPTIQSRQMFWNISSKNTDIV